MALDIIAFIPILIGIVLCIPIGLFQVYKLSSDSYLWLFILITFIFLIALIFSINQLRSGEMSKTDFWGNIIAFGVVGYGGLSVFLLVVQA
jgi:hypothetical protein